MINRPSVVRKPGWWPPRVLARRLWPRRGLSGHVWSRRFWLGAWGLPALGSVWARRLRLGALAALCGMSLAVGRVVRRAVGGACHHLAPLLRVDDDRDRGQPAARPARGAAMGRRLRGGQRVGCGARCRAPALAEPSVDSTGAGAARVSEPADDPVQERRPVAIVLADGPRYVDRRGHVLGPLNDDDSRDFPIISGLDGGAPAYFTDIGLHRALQLLRWCERLSSVDALSEIHVDRRRGVTVFPRHTRGSGGIGMGELAGEAAAFGARLCRMGRTGRSVGHSGSVLP